MSWLQKLKLSTQSASQNSKPEMTAQQELALSGKKAETILSDGRFVSVYQVRVGHMAVAYDTNPVLQAAKLIAQVVKIDDQAINMHQALNLDMHDFNKIVPLLIK